MLFSHTLKRWEKLFLETNLRKRNQNNKLAQKTKKKMLRKRKHHRANSKILMPKIMKMNNLRKSKKRKRTNPRLIRRKRRKKKSNMKQLKEQRMSQRTSKTSFHSRKPLQSVLLKMSQRQQKVKNYYQFLKKRRLPRKNLLRLRTNLKPWFTRSENDLSKKTSWNFLRKKNMKI